MERTIERFNGTAIYSRASGKPYSWQLVQVAKHDGRAVVCRAGGLWTHNNGLPEFHDDWLRDARWTLGIGGEGATVVIVLDEGKAYRSRIARMAVVQDAIEIGGLLG